VQRSCFRFACERSLCANSGYQNLLLLRVSAASMAVQQAYTVLSNSRPPIRIGITWWTLGTWEADRDSISAPCSIVISC
jgi:hypothetical protein